MSFAFIFFVEIFEIFVLFCL